MPHTITPFVPVKGLKSLDQPKQLSSVGRIELGGGSSQASAEQETQRLSGLSIAHKLLSIEKSSSHLNLNKLTEGLVFTETIDNALEKTALNVAELRALAVQASSENLTDEERETAKQRSDEIIEQINEIASNTLFQGKPVLDGSISTYNFQTSNSSVISINAEQIDAQGLGLQPGSNLITGNRAELGVDDIGTQGVQEGDADSELFTDLNIYFNRNNLTGRSNIADRRFGTPLTTVSDTQRLTNIVDSKFGLGIAKTAVERINEIRTAGEEALRSIYASATTEFESTDVTTLDYAGNVDETVATNVAAGSLTKGDLKINGIPVDKVYFLANDLSGTLTASINSIKNKTGIEASVNTSGELQLSASDGRDIVINTANQSVSNTLFGAGENRFSKGFENLRIAGRISLSSKAPLILNGADVSKLGLDDLDAGGAIDNKSTSKNVSNVDLSSSSNASKALKFIDQSLAQILNFKQQVKSASGIFQKGITSTRIDSSSRENAFSIANIAKNLIIKDSSAAITAQANLNGRGTLFFLR